MDSRFRSATCERIRAQIALELDRDFSQLEQARRASHVAHCAECRAFEADLGQFTELLRDAPPERPSRPLSVPRRRLAARSVRVSSAAAAMVFVLVGLTTQLATDFAGDHRSASSRVDRPGPTVFPTGGELEVELSVLETATERPRLTAANSNLR